MKRKSRLKHTSSIKKDFKGKEAYINAKSAVLVWGKLQAHHTAGASAKLHDALIRYLKVCETYHIDPNLLTKN